MKSKPSQGKQHLKWMATAAIAALLAGCAVLTVDVDVYKGPLDNDEGLQIEQLGPMVMGAKPLLITLRDEAECEWNDSKVARFRTNWWYKPQFMQSGTNSSQRGVFTKDIARRVNAILSLYENRGPSYLKEEMAEAYRMLNEYEAAFAQMRKTNSPRAREAVKTEWLNYSAPWTEAALEIVAPKDGWINETNFFNLLRKDYADTLTKAGDAKKALEAAEKAKTNADAALEKAQQEQTKDGKAVNKAKKKQADDKTALDAAQKAKTEAVAALGKAKAEHVKAQMAVTNHFFHAQFSAWKENVLPEGDKEQPPKEAKTFAGTPGRLVMLTNTNLNLKDILKTDAQTAERVRQSLAEAAQRFDTAHAKLAVLWEQSLRLFETIARAQDIKEDVKRRQLEAAADLIGMAINERRFVAAYHAGKANKPYKPSSLRDLAYTISQLGIQMPLSEAQYEGAERARVNQSVQWIVKQALLSNSTTFPHILRMVDFDIRNLSATEFENIFELVGDDKRLYLAKDIGLPVNRRYGLATSVPRDSNHEHRVEVATKRLRSLGEDSTLGFAHGRIDQGLQSLIEAYLQARDKAGRDKRSEDMLAARERMIQALVGFAEKMKFIADNEVLAKGSAPEAGYNDKAKPYVALLQSMGNSILSLVDEYRRREKRPTQAANPAETQQRATDTARAIMATLPPVTADPNAGPSIERLNAVRNLLAFTGQASQGIAGLESMGTNLNAAVKPLNERLAPITVNATTLIAALDVVTDTSFGNAANMVKTNVANVVGTLGTLSDPVTRLGQTNALIAGGLATTNVSLMRSNAQMLGTNLVWITNQFDSIVKAISAVQANTNTLYSQTKDRLPSINSNSIAFSVHLNNAHTNSSNAVVSLTSAGSALQALTNALGTTDLTGMTNQITTLATNIANLTNTVAKLTELRDALTKADAALQKSISDVLVDGAKNSAANVMAMTSDLDGALVIVKEGARLTNGIQEVGLGIIRSVQPLADTDTLTKQASSVLTGVKDQLAAEINAISTSLTELKKIAASLTSAATNIANKAASSSPPMGKIGPLVSKFHADTANLPGLLDVIGKSATNTLTNAIAAVSKQVTEMEASVKKVEAALKELKGASPVVIANLRTNFLTSVGGAANSLSALDTLLEQMRLMHVASIASGEMGLATNLQAAIERARDYRASQVFIRPPSAYLKNSSSASVTQDGNNLGWRNNLRSHGLQSMLGGIINCDKDGRVREEIDKQNWQNINKVKVSAAVTADYVIVKDDIGNWYVKGFSADSGKMIEAARALGLYAGGASMANGILSRTTNAAGQVSLNTTTNLLDRQRSAFDKNYKEATSNQLADLTALIAGLKASVTSNWGADTNLTGKSESLTQRWDKLADKHSLSSTASSKGSESDQILARLAKLRAFRDDLKSSLNDTGAQGLGLSEPQRNAATADAIPHIDTQANEFITRRLETVREYETALRVLGASTVTQ